MERSPIHLDHVGYVVWSCVHVCVRGGAGVCSALSARAVVGECVHDPAGMRSILSHTMLQLGCR